MLKYYGEVNMTLNDRQLEAVNHKEGPCLVLAGAGSGKTRVLTERIIKLIDDGISPYNILAITFTNKAAKEMKERVEAKLGSLSDSIFIGTFHSFGLRILRENYRECGYSSNITILDTDDAKSLINSATPFVFKVYEKRFSAIFFSFSLL